MANSKGVKTIFVRFQSFFTKKVEWSFFANLIFLFPISGKNHFFSKEKKIYVDVLQKSDVIMF